MDFMAAIMLDPEFDHMHFRLASLISQKKKIMNALSFLDG